MFFVVHHLFAVLLGNQDTAREMRALGRKVSLALIASGMSAVVCTLPNSSSMITSNRHI
jgi:hypothetical protein